MIDPSQPSGRLARLLGVQHLTGRLVSWGASLVMLLALIPQFWCHSGDDFAFLFVQEPNAQIGRVYSTSGRYVAALLFTALDVLRIDVMRDFPLAAVACAIGFGAFARAAVSYLWPSSRNPLLPVLGAALYCFHGFQTDLNSFKLQYAVSALMYCLMAAYLWVMAGGSRRPRTLAAAFVLLLLLNFTYQPATMALAVLAVGRALVDVVRRADSVELRSRIRSCASHLATTAALIFFAGAIFVIASRVLSPLLGIPFAKTFASPSWPALTHNLSQHGRAILELLRPTSDGHQYGSMNGGVGPAVWAVLVIMSTWSLLDQGRRGAAVVGGVLVAILLILAQNPQNILMATYWPSARSSFYVSFFTPILAIAAAASAGHLARRRVLAVALTALVFEIGATSRLMIDKYEFMRRDLVLATDIATKIGADRRLADAKGIRFPRGWRPYSGYYAGIPLIRFGGGSLLGITWAQSALVHYAGGPSLPWTGESSCLDAEPRTIRPVSVRREGDDIEVCF